MEALAPKPRILRLQFSLRGLLILMAVLGVALVIFRWPWEVTSTQGTRTFRTPYHRGWNGKPLKHGLERVEDGKFTWNVWYDEGDRRREQFYFEQELSTDIQYRQGKMDGPIVSIEMGGNGRLVGQYRADRKEGEWIRNTDLVWAREQWQAGQRQGHWTWKSSQGQVLQSADYVDDKLVTWNGRPLRAALMQWLEKEVRDPELRSRLLLPLNSACSPEGTHLHYGELLFPLSHPPTPLIVHVDMLYPPAHDRWHDRPFVEALLESALADSNMLCLRYGVINVVPISQANFNWQDRTGIDRIQFAAGSPQEREWLGNCSPVRSTISKSPVEIYQRMFGAINGSSIEVDLSEFGPWQVLPNGGPSGYVPTANEAPRTFRDRLGQHLNRQGYYCEQRENMIVIKPHPETAVAQPR